MAKMFYTMDEAAAKLGVTEEEIKEMALAGKLQQFRDRDKLMFKREEVDALGGGATSTAAPAPGLSETGDLIPLADSGDTDAIDLADTVGGSGSSLTAPAEDPRQATGISVFDADEIEIADPMAQTQVTGGLSEGTDLSLESVGSGSGLLDLTRESDDTSLGAELLDEIYPGGEASDAKVESGIGSSGVFEGAVAMGESAALEAVPTGVVAQAPVGYAEPEENDPAGSGLGIGMLICAMAALIIALIVGIGYVTQEPSTLITEIGKDTTTVAYWAGGIFVGSLILGAVGFFVGKMRT